LYRKIIDAFEILLLRDWIKYFLQTEYITQ
jgi:hypothetical protein